MDFGAPVAQNVNVNPQQGLKTLSEILSLKGQQQQLAVGQSEAQQAQQQMKERLAVQQMMQSGVDDQGQPIKGANGEPDPAKILPALGRIAPLTGQQYAQNILKTVSDRVGLQASWADLDMKHRQNLMGIVQSAALDPTQKSTDINANIDNYASQHPEAANTSTYLKGLVKHLDGMTDPAQRSAAVQGLAAKLQPGQPVETRPQTEAIDTGTQIVQGTVAPPVIGGGFQGTTAVQKQIPPQLVTPPGGIPTVYPGGKGPVPGQFPGVQPTSQDIEDFGAYQHNLNARVSIASDSIPRIQQAEKALDQIRSGAGAEGYAKLARLAQAAGLPQSIVDAVGNGNLGAAQEAEKYLFQTTFSGLRQAMQGDPARVAEFQSAEQVFPSIGTDPRAAKAVLNFMTDQGKRDYAEQQALVKSRKEGNFNPATWQADYQAQLRAGKVPGVPQSQVPGTAETRSKSKSGKPIVLRNGRWEYE